MNLEKICNSFFHDNKSLSSSVLLSYQRQNSKPTVSTLINYILNAPEFLEYFDTLFKTVICSVFDDTFEVDINTLKKGFITDCLKSQKGFSKQDILKYVIGRQCFDDFYTPIIEDLYKFYFTNGIQVVDLEVILEKMKGLDFIEIRDKKLLKRCIEQIVYNHTVDANNETEVNLVQKKHHNLETYKQYFIDKYTKRFGTEPSFVDISHFNKYMSNDNNLVDIYFNAKYETMSTFADIIINTFVDIFKRDISVFEYVKYYTDFATDPQERISLYYSNFISKFNKASNIYRTYLDGTLTHTDFIHKFLNYMDMDDNMFTDTIINIVVNYESYKVVMHNKIETLYKSTFDKDIRRLDLEYFFDNVYQKKLNLIDDNLPKLVSSLKEETDDHENQIENIFTKVLKRGAERSEIDVYIKYFREPKTNVKPGFILETELYESLEYHDILKQLIRCNLKQEIKLNSVVFKLLHKLLHLEDKSIKKDEDKIKEFIIEQQNYVE